jgi:kynurenine aminotransferase
LRLRQALSDAYSPSFGRKLDPHTEIVITSGANEGILSAFMGFVEPGDEVIVMEPYFDQYISNIEMAGGKVWSFFLIFFNFFFEYLPCFLLKESRILSKVLGGLCPAASAGEGRHRDLPGQSVAVGYEGARGCDYEEDADDRDQYPVSILGRPPALMGQSLTDVGRHNPIGKVFSRDELQAIGDLCVKNNIIILSDEVYDRLYYAPFTRIATLSPEIDALTITAGSAGKQFHCTGWRVGYLIGRPELIRYCGAAHTRICFSSVSPLQEAAAIGFEQADKEGFWDRSREEMKERMDTLNQVWHELGIPYTEPEGGYFV